MTRRRKRWISTQNFDILCVGRWFLPWFHRNVLKTNENKIFFNNKSFSCQMWNVLQSLNYFRSESENSLNSDATSQLLAMSKLSNNGLSSPTSPPSMTEDKESNKNNLLLAMLWLQRHREMMNFGQPNPVNPQQQQHQPTESKVRKFRDISLSFQKKLNTSYFCSFIRKLFWMLKASSDWTAKIYSEKLKSFIVYNNISKERKNSVNSMYPFWNKDT